MKIVTVTAQVEVPRVPNFLRMTDGQMLPLYAVSDEGLEALGKEWTANLIARAREMKQEADATEPL